MSINSFQQCNHRIRPGQMTNLHPFSMARAHPTLPNKIRGYSISFPACSGTIPVSVLCNFLFCPQCASKIYLLKMPVPLTKAIVKGRVLHGLCRDLLFLESNADVARSSLGEYAALAERVLGMTFSKFEHEIDQVGVDGGSFREEISVEAESLIRYLMGSRISSRKLGGCRREFEVGVRGLGVSGRIDFLEDNYPVEIKTGVPPTVGVKVEHILQLTWYALLLEHKSGLDVDSGEVFYTKLPGRRVVQITGDSRRWALSLKSRAEKWFKFIREEWGSGG